MTAKSYYEKFKELFPYFVPDVESYKLNKTDGGINVTLVNRSVLNFKIEGRVGWILRRIT